MIDDDIADSIDVELTPKVFYSHPKIIAYNLKANRRAFVATNILALLLFCVYILVQPDSTAYDPHKLYLSIFGIILPIAIAMVAIYVPNAYPIYPKIVFVCASSSFAVAVYVLAYPETLDWLLYMQGYYLLSIIIVSPVIRFEHLFGICLVLWAVINAYLFDRGFDSTAISVFNAQLATITCGALLIAFRNQVNSYQNLKVLIDLHRLSILDAMTEAYNRGSWQRHFRLRFEESARNGVPLTIMLLDLDHFKKVNDTYGHQMGDEVIKTLVETCRHNLRAYDMIGRLGGEEFGILLPETNSKEALSIAERIQQELNARVFKHQANEFSVSTSVGIAQLSPSTFDTKALFKLADKALYQAKEEGRNRVVIAGESDDA